MLNQCPGVSTFYRYRTKFIRWVLMLAAAFDLIDGAIDSPADVTLLVDGDQVADGRVARTVPIRMSLDETMDIGEDTGAPVGEDSHVPFAFSGENVLVTVSLRQDA